MAFLGPGLILAGPQNDLAQPLLDVMMTSFTTLSLAQQETLQLRCRRSKHYLPTLI